MNSINLRNFNLIKKGFEKICNNIQQTSYSTGPKTKSKSTTETTLKSMKNEQKIDSAPLTDTFGRFHTYLRISLSERCNLRCTYCMPAEGVKLSSKSDILTTDEIIYLAKIFVQEGVRKIRLTGGEPTVRKDIINIIENIKLIPNIEQIGITTNGLVLTKLLVPMQRAGLNAINISLDTLKSNKYEQITRRKGWERVIAGIDLAIQLGYKPKINCVLMKNFNDNEICDFVEFTKNRNVDIRFIEYMPFTGNKWETNKMVSFKETLDVIKKKWPNFEELPNGPNDTSKAYRVPGFIGQMGFITSMTQHFCGTCNRLRLTADGNLKVCLFGNTEISLRDAIRNNIKEDDLVTLISNAVKRKKKQHADFNISRTMTIKPYANIFNKLSKIEVLLSNSTTQSKQQIIHQRFSSSNTQSHLTHIDADGKAKMVDVSEKDITERLAIAEATVQIGPEITKLIHENNIAKGDVLSISQIAGILGAKKTSDLIPLCHNIFLSSVKLNSKLDLNRNEVKIIAMVRCNGKTGVEMEALTAVSIAALTVYDMCKAISHNITITNIHLLEKSGGKRKYKKKNITLSTNKDTEGFVMKSFSGPLKKEEKFYPIHL